VSKPAPALQATLAVAAMELRFLARRGENLLVTIVIPAAVLQFFASVNVLRTPGRAVDFLLPGSIALAVIATSLVNLGIATAYERRYGVLKRLGGSPLPRWGLVAAKIAAVLVLEAVQVAILVAVAVMALGWTPPAGISLVLAVAALLLGTLAFAGLGLLLAGTLRAEAVLALANGLFVLFLMVGGIVLPVDYLPVPLDTVARLLPASALADAFRIALSGVGDPGPALATLAAWGVVAAGLAARTFRWE
jgi:ABC-2 type transport system permease protein